LTQADKDKIFRRMMVLQRSKARHAQLVSHEVETGGSDPDLPDFWEDEPLEQDDIHSDRQPEMTHTIIDDISMSPVSSIPRRREIITTYRERGDADEEERWAREAAEAEEAELETEELEIARKVEEAYGLMMPEPKRRLDERDEGMDMDWEALDAMDIE